MPLGRFFGHYALWHYGRAFQDIFRVFGNILWFLYNFFSIPFLLKTLFSPLERRHEDYPEELDVNDFFESFVANIILRVVGAILRLGIVLIGIVSLICTFLFSILFVIVWPFLPLVVGISFWWGLLLLWI